MMNDFLNLNGKMNDWGPFSTVQTRVLVFSIGNPYEGHGPALSPDNDSRCANYVASRVSEMTGARYIAHIPYTTDRVGEIATAWSPGYIPMEECVKKSIEFIKYHCNTLKEQDISFDRILIIVGHGGNNGIEKYDNWNELKESYDLQEILFSGTIRVDLGKILRALEPFSEETRQAYLGVKGGHADTMEHSIATLYGGVDYGALYNLNLFIKQKGIDAALKKWPVIGGLGGYLKFGGERYDALRNVSGLMECLKKFEEDGQIFLFSEFARIVMDISLKITASLVKPSEED